MASPSVVNLFTSFFNTGSFVVDSGIVGGAIFLQVWVCLLGFVVLFWQHLQNSIEDMVGGMTLSQ